MFPNVAPPAYDPYAQPYAPPMQAHTGQAFAQPAYAPYAQPYAPPRYPLAHLAPSAMQAHTGQAFVADVDPNAQKPGPMTKEFWTARTFGLPRWSIPAGAAALALIYSAWASGMFGGSSKRRTSRDPGFFSTSGDPRPRRRRAKAKSRGPARRRRSSGRRYGHDLDFM